MNEPIMPYSYIKQMNFITDFYISDGISLKSYESLIYEIERSLNPYINTSNTPITFYIDSDGGSIEIALKIANFIVNSPIRTIAYGKLIASAATVIFAACKERYVYKDRYTFLMHGIKMDTTYYVDDEHINRSDINEMSYVNDFLLHEIMHIFSINTNLSVRYIVSTLLYGKEEKLDDEDMIYCNVVTKILE